MTVGRAQLAKLTAGKGVINTALRWLPFFLPTLAVAFNTNTSTLTTILGIGEMAGLSSLLIGRQLDGGRERPIMVGSLALVAATTLMPLFGNLWLFGVSYVVFIVGIASYTVAGHTFLSRRVPFERRARTIGIFEISWASALLVGVPIIAVLINTFGWRAPFLVLSALTATMAVVVARSSDTTPLLADAAAATSEEPLGRDAWIVVVASAAIALTGLTTIVIAGTWLDEVLGVSTGGIGLVAMAFGCAELLGSTSSAAVADRFGPANATRFALGLTMIGLVVMSQAGTSLLVGALGLLFFFLGFEFSIVTSFSIVSEAMPAARGRVLAVNNAIGTFARGAGIVASGLLYERFGVRGPVAVSLVAAVIAVTLLTASISRSGR